MERRATGAGGMPVQRVEMTTRDMDVIADLISRRYVEHQARFLPAADLRFESIAPVSASARVLWSHTVAFICR